MNDDLILKSLDEITTSDGQVSSILLKSFMDNLRKSYTSTSLCGPFILKESIERKYKKEDISYIISTMLTDSSAYYFYKTSALEKIKNLLSNEKDSDDYIHTNIYDAHNPFKFIHLFFLLKDKNKLIRNTTFFNEKDVIKSMRLVKGYSELIQKEIDISVLKELSQYVTKDKLEFFINIYLLSALNVDLPTDVEKDAKGKKYNFGYLFEHILIPAIQSLDINTNKFIELAFKKYKGQSLIKDLMSGISYISNLEKFKHCEMTNNFISDTIKKVYPLMLQFEEYKSQFNINITFTINKLLTNDKLNIKDVENWFVKYWSHLEMQNLQYGREQILRTINHKNKDLFIKYVLNSKKFEQYLEEICKSQNKDLINTLINTLDETQWEYVKSKINYNSPTILLISQNNDRVKSILNETNIKKQIVLSLFNIMTSTTQLPIEGISGLEYKYRFLVTLIPSLKDIWIKNAERYKQILDIDSLCMNVNYQNEAFQKSIENSLNEIASKIIGKDIDLIKLIELKDALNMTIEQMVDTIEFDNKIIEFNFEM